jgi:hypothetical protein
MDRAAVQISGVKSARGSKYLTRAMLAVWVGDHVADFKLGYATGFSIGRFVKPAVRT